MKQPVEVLVSCLYSVMCLYLERDLGQLCWNTCFFI